MLIPLAAAVGSVVLGVLLAFVPGRQESMLGPIRSFALTASLAVVFMHLLPEAYEVLGALTFLVFLAGLFLPSLLGAVASRLGRASRQRAGLEVGYVGLLLHHVGDGLSMGALSEHDHGGHGHSDVVVALAAHTVPVAAMVVLAFGGASRKKEAGLRALGLAVSGASGVVLGHVVSAGFVAVTAWVAALTAGMVLHVVAHDLKQHAPTGSWGRTLDFVGAGFGLGLGAVGASGHGAAEHAVFLERLVDFTFDTAPVLLVALLLAALVQANVELMPPRVPAQARRARAAAFGVAHAVSRPLAGSGVLTVGRKIEHPAQMLGLMLAAPVLSIDFALISLRFLGVRLTLAVLVAAALLAWALAALLGGRWSAPGLGPDSGRVQVGLGHGFWLRFQRAFEGLLDHLGIWMVLGLLSAAFVEVYVPSGALDPQHPWLALCVISAVALPSYLSAPSAVPVVAVAIAKGLPPGVAVAGLVLGASFNLRALVFFRSRIGTARSLVLALGIVAGCWALAWVGQGIPAVGEHTLSVVAPHAPGIVGRLATLVLLLLLLRRVWFHGVRAWVAELVGSYAHEHHIAQPAPREVN
ncbi:MAG: hypothetical protein KC766_08150 [Myxococcales bacterium]|nr:hypothetical protein [Myxococcales bacterium]